MRPPLPGLWNPDASAPRNGSFRTDLTHELGHGIACRHFGVRVTSITMHGLVVLDGCINVHGACSTKWWAHLDQRPWDLAVVSAAGAVAECLQREEDPLRDPVALMRSNTEFAGDLEDVLIAAGLHHDIMAADSLRHVATAVRDACDIIKARLRPMRSVVERYERETLIAGKPTLLIAWNEELDAYFSIAPRDERPRTLAWLPAALGQ